MSEFISPPLIISAVLIAFVLGVLLGNLSRRKNNQNELDASFEDGRLQGRTEGQVSAEVEKQELARSLASDFGQMKQGIVQTIQAYRNAIDICSEKLALPAGSRLELDSPLAEEKNAEEVPQPSLREKIEKQTSSGQSELEEEGGNSSDKARASKISADPQTEESSDTMLH